MQDIIWAFSRTPPRSADPDTPISIHHKIGRGKLNLTRTARPLPEPVPQPTSDFKDEVVESSVPNSTTGHEEVYAKPQVVRRRRGERAFASLMHGALCMTGFLLVIPFGVFVVRYAKLTGRPEAFQLHRLLQFGVGSYPSLSSLPLLTYITLCNIQLEGSSEEARLRISSWTTTKRVWQKHTR